VRHRNGVLLRWLAPLSAVALLTLAVGCASRTATPAAPPTQPSTAASQVPTQPSSPSASNVMLGMRVDANSGGRVLLYLMCRNLSAAPMGFTPAQSMCQVVARRVGSASSPLVRKVELRYAATGTAPTLTVPSGEALTANGDVALSLPAGHWTISVSMPGVPGVNAVPGNVVIR
jgi:hypothetical protein